MPFKGRPPKAASILPFSDAEAVHSDLNGAPVCPKELDEAGKRKWREIVKLLAAMGTLNKACRDTMELYCATFAEYQEAQATVKKFGSVLKSKEGGLYRSPYLDVRNHARKELKSLSRMLGLDPASQRKMGVKVVETR